MGRIHPIRITLQSGSRIAFAVVVLASYFAIFSQVEKITSLLDLTLIILLGTSYIALGVYGYDYCAHTDEIIPLVVYFCIQIPLGGSIVYLAKGAGFSGLILLPLVGHAVVLLTQRWEQIVNLAILLAYVVSTYLYTKDWSVVFSGFPVYLAGGVFIMVFTQMAVQEESARAKVEHLVDELEQANQTLRDYAIQAEELAITRERNRLAREIHDGLGHYLTAIHMQIQAVRAILHASNPQVDETLGKAQNLAQEALVDVRQSVAALRASPGQDRPLPDEIKAMPAVCLDGSVASTFKLIGTPRGLVPQSHLTLYRAAQEGLVNSRKHAHASKVVIELDYSESDWVRLSIQDNGDGTDKMDGGFGLLGIQERIHLLGGQYQAQSGIGQGFKLDVKVPG